jgi:hypothetical protein
MRALVGAIITAGSLIGLGLASIGIGNRYAAVILRDAEGKIVGVALHEMDKALLAILVFLTLFALIGMVVTFLGLAFHHHRRHLELLRNSTSGVAHTGAPPRIIS